jgi:hypothetical protein
MSYSNFRKHAVRYETQPSASFDNALASLSRAHTSSQPGVSENHPTVSSVHLSQQRDLQMTEDNPENSSSEEVHFFKFNK